MGSNGEEEAIAISEKLQFYNTLRIIFQSYKPL